MKRVIIKSGGTTHVLESDDIIFIEKRLRKAVIHTSDREIECYITFDMLKTQLDKRFMWCHRSYIINMDKIKVMVGNGIFFDGGLHLYLGKGTYGRAKKELKAYFKE